jgi:hypothetical protein
MEELKREPSFMVTMRAYPDGRHDEDDYEEVTIKSDAIAIAEVLDSVERAIRAIGYNPKGILDFGEEE